MMADRQQMQQFVGVSVTAIGAGHALAPVTSGRVWGLAPRSAPVVPHLIRAYGVSLAGLGVLTLQGEPPQPVVLGVAAGAGALTALTGLLAGLRGVVSPRSAVQTVLAAGGLAGVAYAAMRKT